MIDPGMFGYGDFDINAAQTRAQAAGAQTEARSAKRDLRDVADRIDRLSLVCMAMWSLIQDKTDVTEADLLERVKTIDLMDGKADGKATRAISKCPKCHRVLSPRHRRCIYCGASRGGESAFDAI